MSDDPPRLRNRPGSLEHSLLASVRKEPMPPDVARRLTAGVTQALALPPSASSPGGGRADGPQTSAPSAMGGISAPTGSGEGLASMGHPTSTVLGHVGLWAGGLVGLTCIGLVALNSARRDSDGAKPTPAERGETPAESVSASARAPTRTDPRAARAEAEVSRAPRGGAALTPNPMPAADEPAATVPVLERGGAQTGRSPAQGVARPKPGDANPRSADPAPTLGSRPPSGVEEISPDAPPAIRPATSPQSPPTAVTPEATRALTLREELRLLEAARTALATGNPTTSRAALKRYRQRFPRGELRHEARILERAAHQAAQP